MARRTIYLLGLGAALIIAAGIFFAIRQRPPHVAAPPKPAAAVLTVQPPADCLLPGPPPVAPNGATASYADMKLAQNVIQAFVKQLESYQACRNDQIDHAAPSVSAQQKEIWLNQGNAAVDEANELAGAFSVQLKLFKARSPGR